MKEEGETSASSISLIIENAKFPSVHTGAFECCKAVLISSQGLASFPGLQSPNAVEGLVKLLRRMTSGRCWVYIPVDVG